MHPFASNLLETDGAVCQSVEGEWHVPATKPAALLCGSFDPLHRGHRELASIATAKFGFEVHFELSLANVDKPNLADDVASIRARQFVGYAPLWITGAARFDRKAAIFPGTAFVVGFDTAVRMLDPRYAGSERQRDVALETLVSAGCRVIVGGRIDGSGIYRTWHERLDAIPTEFRELFLAIPESDFRVDLSSTQLRSRVEVVE